MNTAPHFSPFAICCQGRLVTFERPVIMGILNVTPDSFYDGGRYQADEQIVQQGRRLLADGADILDVGVVSTRPGAQMLAPAEEAEKLARVVRLLRSELPPATLISADTAYALPARKAVEAGADIINDVSGGRFDGQMFDAVAEMQVPYVLMHSKGTPATMQSPEFTRYGDIIGEMAFYFSERLEKLFRLGVKDVILDPGFGFAKTLEQNYEVLHRLSELVQLFPQQPMLAALSNKSMIKQRTDDTESGTALLNAIAFLHGARLFRVHTPKPTINALRLLSPTHSKC